MSVRVMNKGVVDLHGLSCVSMIESPSPAAAEVIIVTGKEEIRRDEKKVNEFSISSSSTSSSSSSSSIGKNSDLSTGDKENSSDTVTDHEVQSPYKGPLNAMEDLEEVLPIRRGISRFYNGKSKSFASLAETTSMKEIAKPENPYMKRRRNLLATSCLAWEKNNRISSSSSSSFLKKSNGGGVSKKMVTTTANRTTTTTALAALAVVTMNGTGKSIAECLTTNFTASPSSSSTHRTSAALLQNPHHNFGPWRSYSLVDLQQCISVTAVPRTPLDVKPSQK